MPTVSEQLALERAQARREGLPLAARELRPAMPPLSQNAAPIYSQFIERWRKDTGAGDDWRGMDQLRSATAKGLLPSAKDWESARRTLVRQSGLINLVYTAAIRPRCVFQRDWDMRNPSEMLFPELAGIRTAARLLTDQCRMIAYQGDYTKAVERQTLGFQIAEHVTTDRILIAYLVAAAVDMLAISGLAAILWIADSRGPKAMSFAAPAVRNAIERHWHARSLAFALSGELAFQQTTMDAIRADGLAAAQGAPPGSSASGTPPLTREQALSELDEYTLFQLRHARKRIAVADAPYLQAVPVARAVSAEKLPSRYGPNAGKTTTDSFPVFENALSRRALVTARAQAIRVAAAVFAYRAAKGQFPADPREALPAYPTDPFGQGPLPYRREGAKGEGFSISTAGVSGSPEDSPLPDGNTLFRYPASARETTSRIRLHDTDFEVENLARTG